ncbi:hypothetical protein V490_09173, partial [Pseudogymnoascus sp. VKM F-3557]
REDEYRALGLWRGDDGRRGAMSDAREVDGDVGGAAEVDEAAAGDGAVWGDDSGAVAGGGGGGGDDDFLVDADVGSNKVGLGLELGLYLLFVAQASRFTLHARRPLLIIKRQDDTPTFLAEHDCSPLSQQVWLSTTLQSIKLFKLFNKGFLHLLAAVCDCATSLKTSPSHRKLRVPPPK